MVLNADHMRGRRHAGAAGAARASIPELERLTLKDKAVRKRLGNLLRAAKILVVAFAFAGEKSMDGVMKIVTPDCVKPKASGIDGAHDVGIVFVGFSDDTNLAAINVLGQRAKECNELTWLATRENTEEDLIKPQADSVEGAPEA